MRSRGPAWPPLLAVGIDAWEFHPSAAPWARRNTGALPETGPPASVLGDRNNIILADNILRHQCPSKGFHVPGHVDRFTGTRLKDVVGVIHATCPIRMDVECS